MTEAKEFNKREEVGGVQKVQKFKYLSLQLSLQRNQIIREAKNFVKGLLAIFKVKNQSIGYKG